jgi:hypothetical protein
MTIGRSDSLEFSIKRIASLHEMTEISARADEPTMTNKPMTGRAMTGRANKHLDNFDNSDIIDESPPSISRTVGHYESQHTQTLIGML